MFRSEEQVSKKQLLYEQLEDWIIYTRGLVEASYSNYVKSPSLPKAVVTAELAVPPAWQKEKKE